MSTLHELYHALGGDYEKTLKRLLSVRLIEKLIKMFPDDPNYNKLLIALEENNIKNAFIYANNLTGMSESIGFPVLSHSASVVADALRNGKNHTDRSMLAVLRSNYEVAVLLCERFSEEDK